MTNQDTVGFIGIGAMGEPMARAVRAAGFTVTACVHRNRAPLARLVADGIEPADSPADVGAASDIIVTVVPDAPQVEEALFGSRGVLSGARAGTLFIDMSPPSLPSHHARSPNVCAPADTALWMPR